MMRFEYIDKNILHKLNQSSNDKRLGRRLAELFIIELTEQKIKLLEAIEKKDTKQIKDTAHILKVSAKTVGAWCLAECLEKIENLVESKRVECIYNERSDFECMSESTLAEFLMFSKEL